MKKCLSFYEIVEKMREFFEKLSYFSNLRIKILELIFQYKTVRKFENLFDNVGNSTKFIIFGPFNNFFFAKIERFLLKSKEFGSKFSKFSN